MTRHSLRCSVCNKYVTFSALADDGMCEHCANVVERKVKERLKIVRVALVVLFSIIIALMVLLIMSTTARAETKFVEEYYVTGVNLTTNERVVGWLDGVLGQPEVSGYVLDQGEHYAVVGVVNGKGSFELRSMCCEYDVVVVDEITNNKITNRKKWQESWE